MGRRTADTESDGRAAGLKSELHLSQWRRPSQHSIALQDECHLKLVSSSPIHSLRTLGYHMSQTQGSPARVAEVVASEEVSAWGTMTDDDLKVWRMGPLYEDNDAEVRVKGAGETNTPGAGAAKEIIASTTAPHRSQTSVPVGSSAP